MRFESWDNYIDAMLSQVKFRFDHKDIRLEYEEHMEDKLEFIMDCGMDEERAVREVLAEMGEPESLGKALNEIHNPLLGWIWWVSRIAVRALMILIIFCAIIMGFGVISAISYWLPSDTHGELLHVHEINQKYVINNIDVIIDKAEFYEDGTMIFKHRTRRHFLDRAPSLNHTMSGVNVFSDENGKKYYPGGQGTSNGYMYWETVDIEQLHENTELIIAHRENKAGIVHIEIPIPEELKAGEP